MAITKRNQKFILLINIFLLIILVYIIFAIVRGTNQKIVMQQIGNPNYIWTTENLYNWAKAINEHPGRVSNIYAINQELANTAIEESKLHSDSWPNFSNRLILKAFASSVSSRDPWSSDLPDIWEQKARAEEARRSNIIPSPSNFPPYNSSFSRRQGEFEQKAQAAQDLTITLFSSVNPQATINWLTYESGVIGNGEKVFVRFEYSVANAFGGRAQRRYSIWWNYELTEIIDEQDDFLYFR
ncbi:MAG: hypothetical protein NTY09_14555 [bacterium]|nr:hypothetical protein [bacterium]